MTPSIDSWIKEVKKGADMEKLGMILVHNGIVRSVSKTGERIKKMKLCYNKEKLDILLSEIKKDDNIVDVRVWLNEGMLKIGDDIMFVLVAGKFRKNILPLFQYLLGKLKNEIIEEQEIR